MTREEALTLAMSVLEGKPRSYVDASQQLAEYVVADCREVERLRGIIKTGGAMYRVERSAMGIPGGIDPAEELVVASMQPRTIARKKCPIECSCLCHDMGGGVHDHPGEPCPGKS